MVGLLALTDSADPGLKVVTSIATRPSSAERIKKKAAHFPCRPKCHARSRVHIERMKKGPGFGIHADSRPNRDVEFQIVRGLSAARLSAVMHWKAQWECKRHATVSDSYCGQ